MAALDDPSQQAGRPSVSVVVPFKGSPDEAAAVAASLGRLRLGPGDELVVVDNSAEGAAAGVAGPGLRVVPGALESSSYYARNVGAAQAHGDWLLFVDADCRPSPDLVDRFFDVPPRERDGALAGVVRGVGDQEEGTLVRFSRRFPAVEQDSLPTHLGRPFASTANLLVRAAAFRDAGGFAERVRSGGDIDFSWRLLALGWTIDVRPGAVVEHRHRERFAEFVRPPVRYGAGQAWVLRRWPEVRQPGNDLRHLRRGVLGTVRWLARGEPDEAVLRALLAVYSAAHVVGRALPNRPPRRVAPAPAQTASVVGRLPGDARVLEELRRAPGHVEALGRPLRMHQEEVRELDLNYLEDDAPTTRLAAAAELLARDPRALARWRALPARPPGGLLAVAPAALRLRRAGTERLRVLDPEARPLGDALAALTGLPPAA